MQAMSNDHYIWTYVIQHFRDGNYDQIPVPGKLSYETMDFLLLLVVPNQIHLLKSPI